MGEVEALDTGGVLWGCRGCGGWGGVGAGQGFEEGGAVEVGEVGALGRRNAGGQLGRRLRSTEGAADAQEEGEGGGQLHDVL